MEVGNDGVLTLADGKKVVLAGIQMDDQGVSVLRVLARKQDVKFQLLANSLHEGKESAYAYLKAKYVKFPVKIDRVPDEEEVLINEFLIKVGAAKVDEAQDFSRKARFLKVQDEARQKGEGVWSYQG
ncbi:MAG TPA: thermonuclease family protein [Candidatus Omnitrophota bacterium]|nr:thermonuclease family protein [Candidatus Omnitrophota bacterium]HRY86227.1 thermonuclease family protein [Candidatus Omnitrophota bacterium]